MALKIKHERLAGTITDVGTTFVQQELINAPASCIVRRVRAVLLAGNATTAGLRVGEVETPTSLDIPLEYDLSTLPIDEPWPEEFSLIFKSGKRSPSLNNRGSLWIAVKANTTGNTIKYLIDVEVTDG